VLATPGVTCAIPGATTAGQMRSNAAASDLTLTDDELALLDAG
jgi:aryl-alcohol dehydrogenase-like predicted oxidoreductase